MGLQIVRHHRATKHSNKLKLSTGKLKLLGLNLFPSLYSHSSQQLFVLLSQRVKGRRKGGISLSSLSHSIHQQVLINVICSLNQIIYFPPSPPIPSFAKPPLVFHSNTAAVFQLSSFLAFTLISLQSTLYIVEYSAWSSAVDALCMVCGLVLCFLLWFGLKLLSLFSFFPIHLGLLTLERVKLLLSRGLCPSSAGTQNAIFHNLPSWHSDLSLYAASSKRSSWPPNVK